MKTGNRTKIMKGISMRLLALTLTFIAFGMINIPEGSTISAQIAYQGILTDIAGNPLKDSTYNVTFTLHNDSIAGDIVWTENESISTKSGLFSHMLGSINPLDTVKFDVQYWLGVKKGGSQIGQRIKLGVVPYARRALVADSAGKTAMAILADSTTKIPQIDSSNILAHSISGVHIKDGTIPASKLIQDSGKTDFDEQNLTTSGIVQASAFITSSGKMTLPPSVNADSTIFSFGRGLYIVNAVWNGNNNEAIKSWYVLVHNNCTWHSGYPRIIEIGSSTRYNPEGLQLYAPEKPANSDIAPEIPYNSVYLKTAIASRYNSQADVVCTWTISRLSQ